MHFLLVDEWIKYLSTYLYPTKKKAFDIISNPIIIFSYHAHDTERVVKTREGDKNVDLNKPVIVCFL